MRRWTLLIGALTLLIARATALATPRVDGAIAVRNDAEPGFIPVSVSGAGFGVAAPFSFLTATPIIISAQCNCAAPSQNCLADRCIVLWSDTRIVAKLPAGTTAARMMVTVDGQSLPSEPVKAQYFALKTFDRFEGFDGAAATKLAVDDTGRVWGFHEFSKAFGLLDPRVGTVTSLPLGRPTSTSLFTNSLSHTPGSTNNWAEDIAVDPHGRVWFVESGSPEAGYYPNYHDHARIIRYDPATDRTCIYNIPGNDNQAFGLFYQGYGATDSVCNQGTCQDYTGRSCTNNADCDRVWFTQIEGPLGPSDPGRVTWFDPDEAPCDDGSYDFVTPAGTCGPRQCVDASGDPCSDNSECGSGLCVQNQCPSGSPCQGDSDCQTCCLPPACTATPGQCNDGSGRLCAPFCGNADLADLGCVPLCGAGACDNAAASPCIADLQCALGAVRACNQGSCGDGSGSCQTAGDCPGITECRADDSVPGCLYHTYDLQIASALAGDLVVGDDHALWYTNYLLAGDVGRINIGGAPPPIAPQVYPLAPATDQGCELGWPWKIMVAPKRFGQTMGDIVFTEHFGHSINRFDASRASDPACSTLTNNTNPCVVRMAIPSLRTNDLAADAGGNIWFTAEAAQTNPSLGYVKKGFTQPVYFPPGSLLPYEIGERKLATQFPISANPGGEANRAVDGNTDGLSAHGSVAQTGQTQSNPWWELDLRESRTIDKIRVWGCTDCGSLQNFYVMVSDSPITLTTPSCADPQSPPSCQYQAAAIGQSMDFNVSHTGRYVRIWRAGTNVALQLAEVQVFVPLPTQQRNDGLAVDRNTGDVWVASIGQRTEIWRLRPILSNLALGRAASMSTPYYFAYLGPHVAVDGNTSGRNTPYKEVTLTSNQLQPWWQVDLGGVAQLNEVDVWGCQNCPEVLSNFYVLVSDQNPSVLVPSNDLTTLLNHPAVSHFFVSGNVGRPSIVQINRTGRWVRVQVDWPGTTTKALRLAEVEAFGSSYVECDEDSDCYDGNACTDDVCRYGRCDHVCVVGDSVVDGVNACPTQGQTCQNFKGACCCRADAWPFDTDDLGYFTGSLCPGS